MEKVSDTVYDAALKSYGDANGMRSYSMVVELLVAYYRNIVWKEDLCGFYRKGPFVCVSGQFGCSFSLGHGCSV